jgi:hypothetical protein
MFKKSPFREILMFRGEVAEVIGRDFSKKSLSGF